ncbi:MinD-like ATPase involved in chromosome partitioning or flagellar assembly [Sporanaerobacter acetigenes DSM 13106]|uniref:MinD-like ATPase involved in chromosome partitioning or flagellar assembly n=1 Tax=Sporanaerobacter acetigenes DSM 13106 TaxID=1123281 RepID=A0A1M5U853_9FIRM|nr:MinD-like ATPase involved in chromosome partitioning or flagellar assembly [Sporanaerobacter acetigenes DSM 13106]
MNLPKILMPKLKEKGKIQKNSQYKKENQIIAVWGSPSSGKTVTSVKIAKELAARKKNVIVVFDDVFCPSIPVFFPTLEKKEQSIGKVLTSPNIDQEVILENCITPIKNNSYIAFLGYMKGENSLTYAEYTKERVVDLLILMRHLADYIVIDCSSIITESILTICSLEIADKVIRLSTADFKGISYFQSVLPLLIDQRFQLDNHLKVVSNVKDYQAQDTINSAIKGNGIYLQHIDEIERQYTEGCLFNDLNSKEGKDYERIIKEIIQEVISIE